MKKLILFIVLILGFINENKAQFAASSEIHYYVYVGSDKEYNRNVDNVVAVKFGNQTMKMIPLSLTSLKFRKSYYLNEVTESLNNTGCDIFQHEPLKSNSVNYFNRNEFRYHKRKGDYHHAWYFSKNKEQIVLWISLDISAYPRADFHNFFFGGEFYYHKIEKEELVNLENTSSLKKQNNSINQTKTSSISSQPVHNNNYGGRASSNKNYNNDKQNSKGTWVTKRCTACNGTGKSIAKEYPPYYGGTRTKDFYCNICNGYDYPHSHKTCGICNGKGHVKEYKY